MRRDRARFLPLAAISAATALGLAACGTGNARGHPAHPQR